MGTPREFVTSVVSETLHPLFRRSLEDVVYETLDRRHVPSEADLKELLETVERLGARVTELERTVATQAALLETYQRTRATPSSRRSPGKKGDQT